jgi:tRNA 2-thiouridine synthesizing protein A
MNARYGGTIGNTHGLRNDKSPASIAIIIAGNNDASKIRAESSIQVSFDHVHTRLTRRSHLIGAHMFVDSLKHLS